MAGDILKLKVEKIKWETSDTATFYLANTSGERVYYKAGQFITLIFNHRGEEIRRSYSLSSSPDEPWLAITIKRITNGEISRFMLTKMKVGDELTTLAPAGRFTINDYESDKSILLFAGGSGVTPIFSQIKYVLNRPGKSKLTLTYSNQDAASILFKGELNQLATRHPEQLTRKLIPTAINQAEFYLCGPFSYMRMIRFALIYMGIGPAQIRKENFVLETVPVTATTTNFPPRNILIRFNSQLHNLPVGENQSILQAALQNDLQLPYSCRNGVCSTCTARCATGKIEMVKNDVLTDADIAAGLVLTCTGHPVSDDVEITFDG